MKIDWKKIRDIGLNAMGVKTLAMDDKGKEVLSEDQRSLLSSKFGSEFVTVYEKNLASMAKSDDSPIQLQNLMEALGAAGTADIEGLRTELAAERERAARLETQVTTLSASPESKPSAHAVLVGATTPSFRIDANAIHNKIAADTLTSGRLGAFEGNTIDVSELKTELGTYSSQGNKLDLIRDIYSGFTTAQFMTPISATESYKAVRSHMTSVVQEFSPKWTPSGDAKFTATAILNRRHKINFSIVPADVGNSWLLHLYNENKTPDQMPITRYIVQNILLPSIVQDIELKMIGKGKYKETAPGVVGKAEDSMDGIETLLVAASKSLDKGINFYPDAVDLRSATDAVVVEYIDNFAHNITSKYQAIKMNIFLSSDIYLKYKRGYKVLWGAGSGTEKADFGTGRVDFTNFSLQVLDCLYGSPIIFCTPKSNFIMLQNVNKPQVITDVQKHNYEVRYYGEFWLGVGFAIGEMVFASVPATYDPQATINSGGSSDFWETTKPVTQTSEVINEGTEGV